MRSLSRVLLFLGIIGVLWAFLAVGVRADSGVVGDTTGTRPLLSTLVPGWNLITGTGELTEDYAARNECFLAIYTWDNEAQSWLSFFAARAISQNPEDITYLLMNNQGGLWGIPMEDTRGYWVLCEDTAEPYQVYPH